MGAEWGFVTDSKEKRGIRIRPAGHSCGARLVTAAAPLTASSNEHCLARSYTSSVLTQRNLGRIQGRGPGRKDFYLTLRLGRTQSLTADVALTVGIYEVAGSGNPASGRYVNTVMREGGQSRLAVVVTVPDTSERVTRCP
jgi:hypothetical protein